MCNRRKNPVDEINWNFKGKGPIFEWHGSMMKQSKSSFINMTVFALSRTNMFKSIVEA